MSVIRRDLLARRVQMGSFGDQASGKGWEVTLLAEGKIVREVEMLREVYTLSELPASSYLALNGNLEYSQRRRRQYILLVEKTQEDSGLNAKLRAV